MMATISSSSSSSAAAAAADDEGAAEDEGPYALAARSMLGALAPTAPPPPILCSVAIEGYGCRVSAVGTHPLFLGD